MPDGAQHTVAAEVRAEMARQRKTQADLAGPLGISTAQVGKRLAGKIAFNVVELAIVARVLGVPAAQFWPADEQHVEAAS